MQTLHRLRRFRDLRAVSPGAWPPADGVPSPALVAPDQEERPAFPNPSRPTCAVGLRPAVSVALIGTGPESGAVPRGHPCPRAIRFRLSRERDCLPDRVCRALLVRQTTAHPGDGPAYQWQHDRPPVGVAACLPVCAAACLPGWSAGRLPICMSACWHVWQSACVCPSPVR
jgi:hypothetical protein